MLWSFLLSRNTHNIDLPELGKYATGLFFFDVEFYETAQESLTDIATTCGLE